MASHSRTSGDSMKINKAHFLTLVAKDAIVNQFGSAAATWPQENFWAMVSTVKSSIKDAQLPALMKRYNLASLSDYSVDKGKLL
jgi:hypothetical protein